MLGLDLTMDKSLPRIPVLGKSLKILPLVYLINSPKNLLELLFMSYYLAEKTLSEIQLPSKQNRVS